MSLENIINKFSDYYITTYSAHASILQNLTGDNAKKITILVDGGGLKAHKGTFKIDPKLFENYTSINHKTLHAKIIYLSSSKLLCLMTGNLRTTAITAEENIIILQSVNSLQERKIIDWFRTPKLTNHLFVEIISTKAKNIWTNQNSVWKEIENQVKKIKGDCFNVYAFSPWGSSKFTKEICSLLKGKLNRLNLYTRKADIDDKIKMWIDADSPAFPPIIFKRFTRKHSSSFPHFKAIFITKKEKGKKEEIEFAYIGSANLTEAALFKKANIEHAVFFNNASQNLELLGIFNKLKDTSNWEFRIPRLNFANKLIHEDEIYNDAFDVDNFEMRRVSKELIHYFSENKNQLMLEDCYLKDKEKYLRLKNIICKFKVKAIDNSMFELNVQYKSLPAFELFIKRNTQEEILNQKDISILLRNLFEVKNVELNKGTKIKSGKVDLANDVISMKNNNIRFPMDQFLNNEEMIESKRLLLKRLAKFANEMEEPNKQKYLMWSQILNNL